MISTSEREVLRVIWAGQPMSSREIILTLQTQFDWSESTIKTLLGRLVEKGVLATERQGRAFLYRATLQEDDRYLAEVRAVFEGICQRKHASIIKKLMEELPMTKEELNNLQAILQEKSPVDQVPCNCRPGQCACTPLEHCGCQSQSSCSCTEGACSSSSSCPCENCSCTPSEHCGCQSQSSCSCADGACSPSSSCPCENCSCSSSEHCSCQSVKTSASCE